MSNLLDKGPIFWARIARAGVDDCWPWTGALTPKGYGRFAPRVNGRLVRVFAHRMAYELANGPLPEASGEAVIDHLCRNRACCNPAHLELVSSRTNLLRGETVAAENAGKTHCKWGHEFTSANTYITPRGGRQCRTCQANRDAAYRRRAA